MWKKLIATVMAVSLGLCMTACGNADSSDEGKADGAKNDQLLASDPTWVDLNGNPVTKEIFAKKKITMVHFWGTFCGPCLAEMPGLGAMEESLPEDAQILGVVANAYDVDSSENDKAKSILAKSKAEFTNILAGGWFGDMSIRVSGVPTTVFVDSEGNIIGEPIVGAEGAEKYKAVIDEYLGK